MRKILKFFILFNIIFIEAIIANQTINIPQNDRVTEHQDASLAFYDWVRYTKKDLKNISKHHYVYFLRDKADIKDNNFGGFKNNTCYPFNTNSKTGKCYTYNPFTAGKKMDYGSQCVAFVWGRVYQKLGIRLPRSFYGNAISWWHKNKNNKPSRLKPYYLNKHIGDDSVAIYKGIKHHKTGHVAFVEKIVKEGKQTFVYFNEANWLTYNKSKHLGGWHVRGDAKLKRLTLQKFRSRNQKGVDTILGYIHFKKY